MNPFLTKSHLAIKRKCFLLLFAGFFSFLETAWSAKYQYRANFDLRYGVHTVGSPNEATHRHSVEFEQKAEFDSNWSAVLGARAEVEAAYASQPDRYGSSELSQHESQQFLIRENFLQFKDRSLRIRLGWQQVVWGEAFGFYFADIVNPKDLREAGLGDISQNRIATPLINTQWIFAESSLQFILMPKSGHSRLPRYGSDFNKAPLGTTLGATPLTILQDPANDTTPAEYGLRGTQQFGKYDFSVFYLNYQDRLPVYDLTLNLAPLSATLTPSYKPLQTAGLTMTADFGGYLVRSELLEHLNREINTTTASGLGTEKTNELIYVFGLDLPTINLWTFNLQYSESRVKNAEWAGRKNVDSLASLRVSRAVANLFNFESTYTQYTSDGSQLLQSSLSKTLSSQMDLYLGLDRFDGKSDTQFGRFKDASRVWLMVKATLKK